ENTITWKELHENGAANGLKPENGQLLQEFEAIKTAILKATSKRGHTQSTSQQRSSQENVYTLTKNKNGETATLFYQDANDYWQTKLVSIKSIPKAILKDGWDGAEHVIRPMMAKAKFITSNGAKFHCGENSTKETQYLKQYYAASWCSNFPSKKSSDSVTASNDPILLNNSYVMEIS
ncbi:MAG: hypothetical protein GY821_09210, partial [Gammaproteobacteria bacterium]|nr:hypothetical protein [Gammaproteobacteria bacterium]